MDERYIFEGSQYQYIGRMDCTDRCHFAADIEKGTEMGHVLNVVRGWYAACAPDFI